ncbi:MAG: hypothetical protein N2712_01235 [Brevinematales bacterium]|nr:hypothetical protein [Brevinematales bacterium]
MRLIFSFTFLFLFTYGFGVVNMDRSYIIHPLKSFSASNEVDFLTFTSATAEFGKYLPEPFTDFNHFWIAKAGVFGEFCRYGNIFSVVLFSDIELIASSNSIILFDPRAFYWQEGFLLSYRYSLYNFQFGFTHRCKHDVDNADFVSLYDEVRARVIIWDSIWLRFLTNPLELFKNNHFRLTIVPFLRGDFYVLAVDESVWYRIYPFKLYVDNSEYKVNRIVGSFSLGNVLDFEITQNFGFYGKFYLWYDLLANREIWSWNSIRSLVAEYFFEFSFYIKGSGIRLFFFVQSNLLRDPAIEPYDQGYVNLVHFGLRAIDEKFSL